MLRADLDGGERFARGFRHAAHHRKNSIAAPDAAPNRAWKPRRGTEVNASEMNKMGPPSDERPFRPDRFW